MSKTFLYFAYGSNLLTKRIHINNPSAIRVGIGKLEDYRLDFLTYSQRWKGASATVVSHEGTCVWGAIWEIDQQHLTSLDKQESVHQNVYFPLEVQVCLPNGEYVPCRVYQQCKTPTFVPDISRLPMDRRPSQIYLNTIIEGAKESELPEEYLKFLNQIPHNNYSGNVDLHHD